LFAILVCTMATVAGTVMALYAAILAPTVPGAAGHLLAASIINVPAALMLSRLVVPSGFTGGPTEAAVQLDDPPRSSMDAIAQGTSDGVKILAGVLALLVVAVALVALVNSILALVAEPFGVTLTLEWLLGLAFAPVAWLIGVPWSEAVAAGGLLGKKLVLNELIAYFDLAQTPPGVFSERTRLILTYALCGFANFASLGISIGGLAAMAPERRADFVDLAPLSVVVGTMATLLSGAVIGALTWT
jgi:CNT family concentrative nucleoside transporter